MQPLNYGVVYQDDHTPPLIINRIEFKSNFDFESKIKQILVGTPTAYPHKKDFLYVNVDHCSRQLLLMTEKLEMPILVPYLFPGNLSTRKNDSDLKEWLFINAQGQRARLSCGQFHDM